MNVVEPLPTERPRGRDFARDGFAVLEGFLSRSELADLQVGVESLLRRPVDPSCVRPNNTLVPLRWNDHLVQRVLGSERRAERLCDALGAADLRWISGYVSVKEPRSLPLWWHQDWWCWDHEVSYRRASAQVAVLCYLADTDVHTGALRVLPRSHLKSVPLHAILPEAHSSSISTGLAPHHIALSDLPDQVHARTTRWGCGGNRLQVATRHPCEPN